MRTLHKSRKMQAKGSNNNITEILHDRKKNEEGGYRSYKTKNNPET